jgi:thiol-disulfide isomerase/thioredoxin
MCLRISYMTPQIQGSQPNAMKFVFALLLSGMSVVSFSQTLSIGDKAPALRVEKWIKGPSVASFKPGKVYVIEFWGTWCKPCVETIPHITSVANKYRDKAQVIAVAISDRPLAEVESFVQKQGDQMQYTVARDTQDGQMAKQWVIATKTFSMAPLTFIVDRTGNIAWIGHPKLMEEPLEQIVAGTYDVKANKAEFESKRKADLIERAERAKSGAWLDDVFDRVNKLMSKKEYEAALSDLTSTILADPRALGHLGNWKLNLMIALQKPGVEDLLRALLNTPEHREMDTLLELLTSLTETKKKLSTDAYRLGADFARRIVVTGKDNWQALNVASMSFYLAGEKEEALRTIKAAIEAEKSGNATNRASTSDLEMMMNRLKQFGG